ncbi:MAG: CDF family Co(II)/Ni(II) efflux transporter DmeF [Saezia sp.]
MSVSFSPTPLQHDHFFNAGNPIAERKTKFAVLLTLAMMVAEISGGYIFNSMALLADGWHMSTHALALGVSVVAYILARRYAHSQRFAFGTWKIEILGGYTSALFLVLVAVVMLFQSAERLFNPVEIHYNQAIGIAFLGLLVNLACAWLLKDGHHHHHGHADHDHDDEHGHHKDLNLRAAYIHVLADAATSVLAMIALFAGKLWGADWLDPVMGIVGAVLISVWAYGLIRDTARVLLDAEMYDPVVQEVREVIASSPIKAEICDLHVWRVGTQKYACIVGLLTQDQQVTPEYFKQQLAVHEELVHMTVEINS